DEPLILANADVDEYERVLDMRSGIVSRHLVWRTPGGKRVRVRSTRLISMSDRHLAAMTLEVTMLDDSAPVTVSSQILNRQDGGDEYHVRDAALGEGRDPRKADEGDFDPRKSSRFQGRVLQPSLRREEHDHLILGYTCTNSRMTMAVGIHHEVECEAEVGFDNSLDGDQAKAVIHAKLEPGEPLRITKYAAYHTSTGVPCPELADRVTRTLDRARAEGIEHIAASSHRALDRFWESSDIEIDGDASAQQAIRWNLFQLAQATLATQEQGIAAKGVSGGGYDGHYFWDTEIYVLPFLAYTNQMAARKLIRFRWKLLDAARERASQMAERGALFPWRTINGEEASAYKPAGTAQYHIKASVAIALARNLDASGDVDFLADEGAELLVETARMWADLGFYSTNGSRSFHIHRVTGPDEYTTVVNDNCYTNIMARFNLRYAARTVRFLAEWNPEAFGALCRRTGLRLEELDDWDAAADAMFIPFDAEREINPQDTAFLDLEPWDWEGTPTDKYPLLLHFHPLVIYRHQVLKQTDVVLAMYLRRDQFDDEQKRRNFDFYDPITTGDSSLSACVQSIVAADVGHSDLAFDYFRRALYLDLCDSHGNTADGVHVASCGGVWAGVVHGFAGMVEHGDSVSFSPRLPERWTAIRFTIRRHGSAIRVELSRDACTLTHLDGLGVPVRLG
ncbi:MAG: glycosyl hydrolase family 65 protein, partial [Actinomycetota bacterium]